MANLKDGHSLSYTWQEKYEGPRGQPTVLEALDEITDEQMAHLNQAVTDRYICHTETKPPLEVLLENLMRIRKAIAGRQK